MVTTLTKTGLTFNGEHMKVLKNMVKRHKKSSIPVLDYIKLTIESGERVIVHYTNSDIFIEKILNGVATECVSGVTFLVPIDLIKKVKSIKNSNVYSIELHDLHKLTFSDNGISKTVHSIDPEEYPKVPYEIDEFQTYGALRYSDLLKLKAAHISTATFDTRPVLSNVLFRGGKIISTDSHRLYQTDYKGNINDGEVLLNRDFIQVLLDNENNSNFFGIIKVHEDKERVVVQTLDTVYYHRRASGTYPDVSRLLPTEFNTIITFDDVKKLKDVLTACFDLTKEVPNHATTLEIIDDSIVAISARTNGGEVLREEFLVTSEHVEQGFKIGFSSKYFLDALKQQNGTTITIKLNGRLRPFIVQGADERTISLVLPLRIY
jgi:DNA polymerase III subunit beta